jgi:4-hydroxy-tetrahydrodipicolinate reductase
MPIRIVVAGAAGRTGRRIVALAAGDPDLTVVAALEAAGSDSLGTDAGELAGIGRNAVPLADHCPGQFDVLVDFSLPGGTIQWLDECHRRSRPMVIGTTGHRDSDLQRIRDAAQRIAVLKAPNMSVGVNVLLRLARQLGETLDPSYDVEITEVHHRFKADAPSGTALALRDAVGRGRRDAGGAGPTVVYGRHGETGQRPAGQIGIHSLRSGDTVGQHTVAFGTLGETITIGHLAHSRDTFAAGALRAAKWIVGRPPGMYDMGDVLFGDPPKS